jgi:hypothetical protein
MPCATTPRLALALCALLPLACRIVTVETDPLPDGPGIVVMPAAAVRAWQLVHDGRAAGSLVRFEESRGPQRFLFSVRNVHGQDLGLIDEQGRAWRFRPFDSAEWITTGTVADGARAILDIGPDARLVEVPLGELHDAAEAAARR